MTSFVFFFLSNIRNKFKTMFIVYTSELNTVIGSMIEEKLEQNTRSKERGFNEYIFLI